MPSNEYRQVIEFLEETELKVPIENLLNEASVQDCIKQNYDKMMKEMGKKLESIPDNLKPYIEELGKSVMQDFSLEEFRQDIFNNYFPRVYNALMFIFSKISKSAREMVLQNLRKSIFERKYMMVDDVCEMINHWAIACVWAFEASVDSRLMDFSENC